MRHSAVRVCFYNLKLFCPSLVDGYDEAVREQGVLDGGQLPQVWGGLAALLQQRGRDA